jgi:hypothetical protein
MDRYYMTMKEKLGASLVPHIQIEFYMTYNICVNKGHVMRVSQSQQTLG